jgi:hypothetical protein
VSLNLLESSGPVKDCNGIAVPFKMALGQIVFQVLPPFFHTHPFSNINKFNQFIALLNDSLKNL